MLNEKTEKRLNIIKKKSDLAEKMVEGIIRICNDEGGEYFTKWYKVKVDDIVKFAKIVPRSEIALSEDDCSCVRFTNLVDGNIALTVFEPEVPQNNFEFFCHLDLKDAKRIFDFKAMEEVEDQKEVNKNFNSIF